MFHEVLAELGDRFQGVLAKVGDLFHGVLAELGLGQKEATILFLGLDNAGKTTVLHLLKNEDDVPRWLLANHPTMQNPIFSEEFSIGQVKFTACDLGGHRIGSRVWRDYYANYAKVDAVVYLVNASDWYVEFEESKKDLEVLLSDESLATVPFLILSNRIPWDPFTSLYTHCESGIEHYDELIEEDLSRYMGLKRSGKGKVNLEKGVRPLEIFACRTFTGMRYADAFKWLSQYIKSRK